MDVVLDNLDVYADGFWVTVQLAVLSFAVAMALGAVVATMRVSPVAPARAAGAVYVELVRNTPLTVLFVLFWFGFPYLDLVLQSRFLGAVVVLSVYTSAFVAEALRSGINAVATGQAEAARSLGLTFGQTLFQIVLPQALRTVVQPLGSLFIALTKNSSVATVIALPELMYRTNNLVTEFVEPLWLFGGAAVAYLMLTLPSGLVVGWIERPGGDRAMSQAVLYDQLGPRGRRRVLVASTLVSLLLVALLVVAVRRFAANDQLDADKWRVFTEAQTLRFLWQGLQTTLKAAAISMTLSVAFGALLALGRLSRMRVVRWVAGTYVEVFRSVPLLLLIFFSARGLQSEGVDLDLFWYLVAGLVLYNSAILGEIFRAGIRSLDRGQTEAAYAVGLGYWPTMVYVVIPQAVRRMLPSLVSQLVTLLKDTTLGFVLPVAELLQHGETVGRVFPGQELQAYIVVAAVFIAICFSLSRVARRLEVRQRRRYGAGGVGGVTEDLAVLDVAAEAELTKPG